MEAKIIAWAAQRDDIRAVILTSTRTNPNAPLDFLSDYDVILVTSDIQPYFESRAWLGDFGSVLVVYRDPIQRDYGIERFAYITQYEDSLKIDFILWPVEMVAQVIAQPTLPAMFDVGYRVLLDKDQLTVGLKPPTYQAYLPTPPSHEDYDTLIELFFHEATYVAKHLWRDDLMAAKYNLDHAMKFDNLRTLLEWWIGMNEGWSRKLGAYGRGIKKRLSPEIWAALEQTYSGAGLEETWESLYKTIALFQQVAREVGHQLGYAYRDDLHERVLRYLRKVQHLDPKATAFPMD